MKNEKYVKDYFRSDNTVANWWNPTLGDYAHIFKKEELIVKNWFQGKNISSCLEVSCGKGRITKLLHNLCIDYLATDISPQMLSIAQKNVPNAHFRIEDAESLSFDCESKDAIICLEALVHYPNPEKAGEIRACCVKGKKQGHTARGQGNPCTPQGKNNCA